MSKKKSTALVRTALTGRRLSPGFWDGVRRVQARNRKKAREALHALSPEERKAVFAHFCVYCGSDLLPCHCENDE